MYTDSGDGGEPRGNTRRVGLALLGLLGVLLLLPGACGVVFSAMALATPNDPYMGAVLVISLPSILVGVLGIWVLRVVRRKARNPQVEATPSPNAAGPEGE